MVTAWDPGMAGFDITALAVNGNKVYVGGDFWQVGGQSRNNIAALDATTGLATTWNPDSRGGFGGGVRAIALRGDVAYVGGDFTSIGGQARRFLAALDTTSGAATPWNPDLDEDVRALALGASSVYVGGDFSMVGGQTRRSIAEVDFATGVATAWNPDGDGAVDALALSGSTVYVGGAFWNMGGRPRRSLAALDAVTGAATAWNPEPDGGYPFTLVQALAISGSSVYVGGSFSSIGGQTRSNLAAVERSTGTATSWVADADEWVWGLFADERNLYAGGRFRRIGSWPRAGLAAIPFDGLSAPVSRFGRPVPQTLSLLGNEPNPARSWTEIHYSLSAPAPVSLSVYDVQGRCVASVKDHELEPAGMHSVPLRTEGWAPGCYLYRLEAGGRTSTRKMLILK